jgi:hypothetical protein
MEEVQRFADLLVLGMTDVNVLATIEAHKSLTKEPGCEESQRIVDTLVIALDNMYGEGSYQRYHTYGILPSQQ